MKHLFLSFIFAGALCSNAFAYQETETYTVREKLTINTVSYTNRAYVAPKAVNYKKDCRRAASSIEVARNHCGCKKCAKPIKVKTYTEVIDHYQVYKPVTKYVPAGTISTHRIVK